MALKKTTKPCEIISFFPADLSPNDDGSIMVYIALDDYSEFLFNLGTSTSDSDSNLLNAIKKLMNNKDFKRYRHPFTLVLHKYEYLRSEIEAIIQPHGGTFIVDDYYVNDKIMPVLKMMMESLYKKRK